MPGETVPTTPTPHSPPAGAVASLADRIERAASGSSRFLLGIAGSPGSGKTTLAAALVAELNTRRPGEAVALPMDGFHLANRTLDQLGRRDRKGAIDTFDGWGFLALLQRVHAETDHTVFAPSFRREVDEGVAGEIAIDPEARVVVVEGNYLLVDDDAWGRVRDALDEAWFCETPDATREARLVNRHTHHGRTVEAATAWAREVDGANAALIQTTRVRADLVVSGETGRFSR